MNLQVPAYKHCSCEHSAVAYGSVQTKEHMHDLFVHSQTVLNAEAEYFSMYTTNFVLKAS